jgi:hypothetical protein
MKESSVKTLNPATAECSSAPHCLLNVVITCVRWYGGYPLRLRASCRYSAAVPVNNRNNRRLQSLPIACHCLRRKPEHQNVAA